ncbi:SigE family RNA polymerase sigma factor [Sphaerisporangium aureirubrum]|uniref:SigE family RNA polymerase sigma factor n=1 Tax=Sphaerisporangium aureirubrum TaxID=1544736 RepID=A0ABW1NVW6_9ACTN
MEQATDFVEFVRSRGSALYRYGFVLTGNAEDAGDLVQEALMRLGDAWPRVRNKENPEGYVRTAMARLHVSWWRRRRREQLMAVVPESGYADTDIERLGGDTGVWTALGTLPRRQRAVLVLRYYEDLTDEEIAGVLGVSRGTVRSQASRALGKLRIGYEDLVPEGRSS